jgi:hypothetical protein
MKRLAKWFLFSAVSAAPVIILGGCTAKMGDFALLATKNVDLTNLNTQVAAATPKVTGEDSNWEFLYLTGIPSMKDATERAEEKGNGVGLANAHVEFSYWNAAIFGSYKFVVTGSPIPR